MSSPVTVFRSGIQRFPARCPYGTVATMVVVNLAAFWVILHGSYDAENYGAAPADYGRVDQAWGLVSGVAAIAFLFWLRRKPEECRVLARAGLVATMSSVILLAKRFWGGPVQCLDPILFATACGWAAALWLSRSKILNPEIAPGPVEATTLSGPKQTPVGYRGGLRGRVNPATLLKVAVGVTAAALCAYYLVQQVWCLNNLGLGYDDCGEPARIMYNTFHNPRELFLRVNPDKPLFFDHFQPGIVPLVPAWILWPDLKVTILLQVISTLAPVLPLLWLGRRLFRDEIAAALLALAWLVYPSTSQFIYSGSYGFRWGNVCLLLYFLALAFWAHGRHGWALAMAVWAILIKEEAAILAGMFGLYLALFGRRRLLGAIIAVAAFGYFLVLSSLVVPAMSHAGYSMQRFFSDLGATKGEIFLSPWTKPRIFWGRLLAAPTWYFGALLLAPLLFVPLRKVSILFVGSLIFVFDCEAPMMLNSICYWYQAALLPVVFWALAEALRTADTTRRRAVLASAVMTGVLLSVFFGNSFWSKTDWSFAMLPGRLPVVQRMARRIDPNSSLFATPRVAAHFITQKYLYTDPTLPLEMDYILLDLHDPRLSLGARFFQYHVEALPEVRLVGSEDGLLLYARHGPAIDRRAVAERDALPADAIRQESDFGSDIRIVGIRLVSTPSESIASSDVVDVTTFSTVAFHVNADVALRCILEVQGAAANAGRYASPVQFLGQNIWPVARWTPGKLYADDFLITVPKAAAAKPLTIHFEVVPLSAANGT